MILKACNFFLECHCDHSPRAPKIASYVSALILQSIRHTGRTTAAEA